MGYQLIYNSSFKDIDENTINIEIISVPLKLGRIKN